MSGGDNHFQPPPFDGEYLLGLLQNRRNNRPPPPSSHNPTLDPAVFAVGPSLSPPSQNPNYLPPWPNQLSPSNHPSPFLTAPHHHFRHHQPPQKPPHQQSQSQLLSQSNSMANSRSSNLNYKRELGYDGEGGMRNGFDPIRRNRVQLHGSNESNLDRNYDLFKERDLGFNYERGVPNGFDRNRGKDPFFNRLANPRMNLNESNLDRGFDLLKEREMGFNHESGVPNGFDSNRGNDPRLNWGQSHGLNSNSSMQRNNSANESNLDRGFDVGSGGRNGFDSNRRIDHRMNWGSPPEVRRSGPPPGFPVSNSNERRFLRRDGGGGGVVRQVEHPGLPGGSDHVSVLGSDVEELFKVVHGGGDDNGVSQDEVDELSEQLVDSVLDEGPSGEKGELSANKKHPPKDFRSDARGKWILPQRTRNDKQRMECRRDIHRLSSPFLAIFESLIPPEEEKLKQNQLMALLKKLVCSEWPNAKLYVYGSCANSFGVSKSDIDICLDIEDQDIDKAEILLRLADILQSDNFQNVQALTRARVPIVKLMDPVTGISCDICINNNLAVVNTKLLRDYAEIDVRLRQLAFLVKHWAKSRGVNETYQGTLSSYAYVLMCIHFLQQRNPPILPCLQGMKPTYTVTVEHNECAFFDQVDKLRNFGAHNKENIAQLMWAFFRYWAYCHDYANTVVSVRTGDILSKHEKDWTRRIGNDRHLICIEDPFEVSHDLGRVVDKHSIRVLREEFERAAWIMQYDPNPCVSLFEPYVPPAP